MKTKFKDVVKEMLALRDAKPTMTKKQLKKNLDESLKRDLDDLDKLVNDSSECFNFTAKLK